MTGRVEGKVAFITGAARGQGRSHAVRLAEEGADIIAVDIAEDIESVRRFYPGATEGDLAETVKEVEAMDRRIVATKADVRDYDTLKAALDDGVAQLGRLDIVSANAGIFIFGDQAHLVTEGDWREVISIHLQRRAVPRVRRGEVRHRGRPPGGRRVHDQVGKADGTPRRPDRGPMSAGGDASGNGRRPVPPGQHGDLARLAPTRARIAARVV